MSSVISPTHSTEHRTYELIVLTASAGGIEALTAILACLPPTFPIPIVVLMHHAPERTRMLIRVLAARTSLRVVEAVEGRHLEPGVVYVGPADKHLGVTANKTLASSDGRKINFLRSSADPLLDSVVSVFGRSAVAIILSGSGRNGAQGAKALHDAGGLVIAQDRESSLHFGMPGAAIAAGAVNRVLPLRSIGPALLALA